MITGDKGGFCGLGGDAVWMSGCSAEELLPPSKTQIMGVASPVAPDAKGGDEGANRSVIAACLVAAAGLGAWRVRRRRRSGSGNEEEPGEGTRLVQTSTSYGGGADIRI